MTIRYYAFDMTNEYVLDLGRSADKNCRTPRVTSFASSDTRTRAERHAREYKTHYPDADVVIVSSADTIALESMTEMVTEAEHLRRRAELVELGMPEAFETYSGRMAPGSLQKHMYHVVVGTFSGCGRLSLARMEHPAIRSYSGNNGLRFEYEMINPRMFLDYRYCFTRKAAERMARYVQEEGSLIDVHVLSVPEFWQLQGVMEADQDAE